MQALNDADLKALGRLHTVEEALAAVATANAIFDRVSFDLIYARPAQTPDLWRAELGQALSMAGGHLSLYQLTIEPDTPFEALHRAGKLVVPDPDAASVLYEITQEMCAAAGLPAYEISNHARPGQESRHNLIYWRYGEYAGIGPGAHGRLVIGGARHAQSTERAPEKWLASVEIYGHALVEDDKLSDEEQGDEFLVMGLRLGEGIDAARFAQLAGRNLDPMRIDELTALGMIRATPDGRLIATPDGALVLNAVVADLAA